MRAAAGVGVIITAVSSSNGQRAAAGGGDSWQLGGAAEMEKENCGGGDGEPQPAT